MIFSCHFLLQLHLYCGKNWIMRMTVEYLYAWLVSHLSAPIVVYFFYCWLIATILSSMCNQEFNSLLSTLSSIYISNHSIMQQISCIAMYFATIDEWTSYSGVLDLVRNLISYTHNFCNNYSINPNNLTTINNRMYPLFSIFQNMSHNR